MKTVSGDVARLHARPTLRTHVSGPGMQQIQADPGRRALLYAPKSALAEAPTPLAVMLHGAGGNAEHGMELLRSYADNTKLIVLAPESLKTSWDIISDNEYGQDVCFIDKCLSVSFERFAIDPSTIALGGFSDGASYALSLGLSNGLLFRTVLAFSPGFMAPVRVEDQPRIFVSHGTRDKILPVDLCGRRLSRALRAHPQLTVEYREFEGPHTVPPEMKEAALRFFLGDHHGKQSI